MDCRRKGEKEDLWEAKSRGEQPLREQRELEKRPKHMNTWQACSNQATLEPDPIEDLLVMNTLEYMDTATRLVDLPRGFNVLQKVGFNI
jgi:hypothetical protein